VRKVSLTDNEATALRVAIRLAQAVNTELVSMTPSEELRGTLMGLIRNLHTADRKLT
jgi:hypothetical protein